MADEDNILNFLREKFDRIDARFDGLEARLTNIESRVNGLPLIGEAIATLQRDSRMLRAAINDIGSTDITAGEVEAMHTDIDRVLAKQRELEERIITLEQRRS